MKATLTFKLPEERTEHRIALDGWKWRSVVWDLNERLRNKIKHAELSEEIATALWNERKELLQNIEDMGLDLYEE